MIGVLPRRNDPDYVPKFASADVGQHVRRVKVDIIRPVRVGALGEILVVLTNARRSSPRAAANWCQIGNVGLKESTNFR